MNLLKEAGYNVTFYRDQFNMETFASMIPEYDVLIIGGHKFPAELMEKCPHLKLICKHGAGLDNLDLAKAKELGITVTNAARTNANAVADLAFGMMLNCARKISVAERDVRAGNWHTLIGHDVYQKTLGLIGFGAIARNMARRAAGFSMKVLAYDPFIAEVPEEFRSYVTLCADRDEVLRNCDYLSLHLQLTEETRNNISKTEMDKMRRGAVIINTSRGGIVNEGDLVEALKNGTIAGAGTDVYCNEPPKTDDPLLNCPNLIVSPHSAAQTREAVIKMAQMCVKGCLAVCQGKKWPYVADKSVYDHPIWADKAWAEV